jgi:hypothetical protein
MLEHPGDADIRRVMVYVCSQMLGPSTPRLHDPGYPNWNSVARRVVRALGTPVTVVTRELPFSRAYRSAKRVPQTVVRAAASAAHYSAHVELRYVEQARVFVREARTSVYAVGVVYCCKYHSGMHVSSILLVRKCIYYEIDSFI